jgi:hypothetical protein
MLQDAQWKRYQEEKRKAKLSATGEKENEIGNSMYVIFATILVRPV